MILRLQALLQKTVGPSLQFWTTFERFFLARSMPLGKTVRNFGQAPFIKLIKRIYMSITLAIIPHIGILQSLSISLDGMRISKCPTQVEKR